ncbi:hypothetical protein ACB098_01G314600 [Castanea mollissima]
MGQLELMGVLFKWLALIWMTNCHTVKQKFGGSIQGHYRGFGTGCCRNLQTATWNEVKIISNSLLEYWSSVLSATVFFKNWITSKDKSMLIIYYLSSYCLSFRSNFSHFGSFEKISN